MPGASPVSLTRCFPMHQSRQEGGTLRATAREAGLAADDEKAARVIQLLQGWRAPYFTGRDSPACS